MAQILAKIEPISLLLWADLYYLQVIDWLYISTWCLISSFIVSHPTCWNIKGIGCRSASSKLPRTTFFAQLLNMFVSSSTSSVVCPKKSRSTDLRWHIAAQAMFLPPSASHQREVAASELLGVPRCLEGLSEMIASVFFFFSVRYGANKRETYRVEWAHFFAFTYYPVKTIIMVDKPPVIHLSVF